MGSSFDNVGSFKLASSGKSLALDILPEHSVFTIRCYIGLKDLESVVQKRKKSGTIYKLKENAPRYKTRDQKRVEAQMDR